MDGLCFNALWIVYDFFRHIFNRLDMDNSRSDYTDTVYADPGEGIRNRKIIFNLIFLILVSSY